MKNSTILRTSALLTLFAVLLIPTLALAVPGSGDMVSLYSNNGREMTELYNVIARICLVILVLVEGVLIFAILKFRRRSDDERPRQNHGDMRLEIGWTLAAAILQIYIGWITIDVMWKTEIIPENIDITIEAIAYQWDWQFRYPEHGNLVSDDLVIPAHANVKLEVTSRDVIHAIFVPDLGVKMDAVPGRFNYWWFNADGPLNQVRAQNYPTIGINERLYPSTRPDFMRMGDDASQRTISGLERQVTYLGHSRQAPELSPYAKYNAVEYQGVCAELCGKGHYDMYFRAVVMSPASFRQWVHDKQTEVRDADGPAIFAARCAVCHGAEGLGAGDQFPTLVGAARVTQDTEKDAHIGIVITGQGVMPPFGGVLNDAEVAAVVNHERTSWGNAGGLVTAEDAARVREALGQPAYPAGGVEPLPSAELMTEGQRLYQACSTCHGNDGRGLDIVPNIAQSALVLGEPAGLVSLLDNGRNTERWPGEKTPMGRAMADYQVAALLTYIRNSFGNDAGDVQPHDVTRIRSEKR
ncbi:MAG: c-type cytochrome [Bradymonadaceae bacterium]|nr:c-type cytochrome [Lujinxingiaceae bacterium]